MITRNIIFIIIIIIVIGLIVYAYYNRCADIPHDSYIPENKKVRFNKKIQYNNLSSPRIDTVSPASDSSIIQRNVPKIKVDNILNNPSESPIENRWNNTLSSSPEENNWDKTFNTALADKNEDESYYNNIINENKKTLKSMDYYDDYKNKKKYMCTKKNMKNLKNKTIKDIYDNEVSNVTAIPKKIKSVNENEISYDNDSEINGDNVMGFGISAYDTSKSNMYENFDFDIEKNDF